MNIFLDDFRKPENAQSYMYSRIGNKCKLYTSETWTVVKNYDEFCEAVVKNAGNIGIISFDHDLADEHYNDVMFDNSDDYVEMAENFKEKTGFECAQWLIKFYKEKELELPTIFVHSMNPVGVERINNLFK